VVCGQYNCNQQAYCVWPFDVQGEGAASVSMRHLWMGRLLGQHQRLQIMDADPQVSGSWS